jgi:hypothetical protein
MDIIEKLGQLGIVPVVIIDDFRNTLPTASVL